jgi:hypothetical protein
VVVIREEVVSVADALWERTGVVRVGAASLWRPRVRRRWGRRRVRLRPDGRRRVALPLRVARRSGRRAARRGAGGRRGGRARCSTLAGAVDLQRRPTSTAESDDDGEHTEGTPPRSSDRHHDFPPNGRRSSLPSAAGNTWLPPDPAGGAPAYPAGCAALRPRRASEQPPPPVASHRARGGPGSRRVRSYRRAALRATPVRASRGLAAARQFVSHCRSATAMSNGAVVALVTVS